MNLLFETFRKYLMAHPKEGAYNSTSDKFDAEQMVSILDSLNLVDSDYAEEDIIRVADFIQGAKIVNAVIKSYYSMINDYLGRLNSSAREIEEYVIAVINREFLVLQNLHYKNIASHQNDSYYFADLDNYKVEASDGTGMVTAKAALEGMTDSAAVLLGYLRHFQDETVFHDEKIPAEGFTTGLINMMKITSYERLVKQHYYDALYNEGFIWLDSKEKIVHFDTEEHEHLRLLLAGQGLFSTYELRVIDESIHENQQSVAGLSKYRIKKLAISNGEILVSLGQGKNPKLGLHHLMLKAAVLAYYEYLDLNMPLPNIPYATIADFIAVWAAMHYLCSELQDVSLGDHTLYTKEDIAVIPRKIRKPHLIEILSRLSNVSGRTTHALLMLMEATRERYNNIWEAPLYSNGEFYLFPIFPLSMTSPYFVIDYVLQKSGYDLDKRGKAFEQYLITKLNSNSNPFPVMCLPAGKYGTKENWEEIDLIVGMKNIVIVADAKCIKYPLEERNYHDAWERLKEGCEQTNRKALFVKNHPEHFTKLGDYSRKRIVKMVVTNYPNYTGFVHEGVYVIDAHSFLSYMAAGVVSLREFGLNSNALCHFEFLYTNEDEYSNHFETYLQKNPVKELLKEHILIREQEFFKVTTGWVFKNRFAQYDNNPQLDIRGASNAYYK